MKNSHHRSGDSCLKSVVVRISICFWHFCMNGHFELLFTFNNTNILLKNQENNLIPRTLNFGVINLRYLNLWILLDQITRFYTISLQKNGLCQRLNSFKYNFFLQNRHTQIKIIFKTFFDFSEEYVWNGGPLSPWFARSCSRFARNTRDECPGPVFTSAANF